MRKERNMKLLAQLASTRCDTSQLKSSKTLGSGRASKRHKPNKETPTPVMVLDGCNELDDKQHEESNVENGTQLENSSPTHVKTQNPPSQNRKMSTSHPMGLDGCDELGDMHYEESHIEIGMQPKNLEPTLFKIQNPHSQNKENSIFNPNYSREPALNSFGRGLKQPLPISNEGLPVLSRKRRQRSRSKECSSGSTDSQEEVQDNGPFSVNDYSSIDGDYSSNEQQEMTANNESIYPGNLRLYPTGKHDSIYYTSKSDEYRVSATTFDYNKSLRVEVTAGGCEPEPDIDSLVSVSVSDPEIQPQRSKSFMTSFLEEKEFLAPTPTSLQIQHVSERQSNTTSQPVPPQISMANSKPSRDIFNVHIERPFKYQESRQCLPVVAEEYAIMEAIHNHPVVIICGATGSGKTTQVPQFLFEAGYGSPTTSTPGLIGITQPRRVAAVSSATRVEAEMGALGSKVSYQVRFDSTVDNSTAIKYMTDGILVREATQDVLLSKYSAIIIDEAHERSVNTDLMIGYLSRLVHFRNNRDNPHQKILPLKLIIMSATLGTYDLLADARMFPNTVPPVVQVEGRQHTVTDHFARVTRRDYLEEAFQKVLKGHKKLPPGGMLVFLTGEDEINTLNARLHEALSKSLQRPTVNLVTPGEMSLDSDDAQWGLEITTRTDHNRLDEVDNIDEDEEFLVDDNTQPSRDVRIIPLYSQLSMEAQLRVFDTLSENCRLIVLATNIAETSLTIPGIRYVFDSGRVKEKKYNPVTGVQSFEISWISKASASQRAGRAGRTGPGHIYRLYSSAVYEQYFAEHAEPEILRTPIEGIVLQLKALGLPSIVDFQFPTSPDPVNLWKAEKQLTYLKAVTTGGVITSIGQYMARYPISPRFARMISLAYQTDCAHFTLSLVACLAVQELFAPNPGPSSEAGRATSREQHREKCYRFTKLDPKVDFCKAVCAFEAYLYESRYNAQHGDHARMDSFCCNHGLRPKAFREAKQLYDQLLKIYQSIHGNIDSRSGGVPDKLKVPTTSQIDSLRQIVAAGYIDQIAIRADLSPYPPTTGKTPKRATDVPYLTLFPSHEGRAASIIEKAVYIHPSSVLAKVKATEVPHYIIYSHLKTAAGHASNDSRPCKVRMVPLTNIPAHQIANLARDTPLLHWSKPSLRENLLREPSQSRTIQLLPSLVGENGSHPWPLPCQVVRQVMSSKLDWVNVPGEDIDPGNAREN